MNRTNTLFLVALFCLIGGCNRESSSHPTAEAPDSTVEAQDSPEPTSKYFESLWKSEAESVPRDSLREVKNEGEVYAARSVFQATADVRSERLNELWKAEVKGVRYSQILEYTEQIVVSSPELGRIESIVTIHRAQSTLESAKVSFSFLVFDSRQLVQLYGENEDLVRRAVQTGGAAAGLKLASLFGPAAVPAGALVGGIAADRLWLFSEREIKERGYALTPEGEVLVPPGALPTILPGNFLGAEMDINDCGGTQWRLVWIWGKGYETIECLNADAQRELVRNKESFNRDLEVVEGLLRKSSMVSAGMIFPPALQPIAVGKTWEVDASAFAVMLAQGLKFDELEGSVWLTLKEKAARKDLEDENSNTGGDSVEVSKIGIHPRVPSSIRGLAREGKNSVTSFKYEPSGDLQVVYDDKVRSCYVREATLGGKVSAMSERHAGKLWRGVKITGDAKAQIDFQQLRIIPASSGK